MMTDWPSGRSYWNSTARNYDFPSFSGQKRVDVAIVGGGIVGVTAARLLSERGLSVGLLEAQRLGRQVTGRSTAKVTSQHGLLYQILEQKFDEARARLYAEAQEASLALIRQLVREHGLECDLEERAAYVYTQEEGCVELIEKEAEVAQRLGLPARLVRELDLPFEVWTALRFEGQAQFHPTNYVLELARSLPLETCHVFENSRVVDWGQDFIATEDGRLDAGCVIMATHLPLGQIGGYYARAFPQAEPVIAAEIPAAPEGMYICAEQPSRSLRTHRHEGKVYGIAAGGSFKPGHTDDERKEFEGLSEWLRSNFGAGPPEFRWVNEDYTSMDRAPFVGWSGTAGDSYLVATGFDAWGITNGTAAAMIIADLVMEQENSWLEIFDARRVKPLAGGAKFVKESTSVAAHLVSGYLARRLKSYDDLVPGDAGILKIDGQEVAAFRDEGGSLHAVSAKCTHMGCILGWNEIDRTWDCPCHGSRFSLQGEVLHGPAFQALSRIE
ncbi:MAG TPA: FAD-dependent oxidoreductase [Kiloniellales bacterium]|nr:FAD-dependent oxidoreductase [Kiloniellales bacterium]